MISIEKTSRILNHFNIAFTESAVVGYIQRKILKKAPRIDEVGHSRFSKYNYSVDKESLVKMLLDRGVTEKEIDEILSV